jgi:hypothetical protein
MKSWHQRMPMRMNLKSTPSASRISPRGAGSTLADFQTATDEEPCVVHRPRTTVPASTALMHAQSDAPVFPRLGALANEGPLAPLTDDPRPPTDSRAGSGTTEIATAGADPETPVIAFRWRTRRFIDLPCGHRLTVRKGCEHSALGRTRGGTRAAHINASSSRPEGVAPLDAEQ